MDFQLILLMSDGLGTYDLLLFLPIFFPISFGLLEK